MTDSKAAVLAAYQAELFRVAFDADSSPADVQQVADELAEGARGDARERARRAYREVADPAGVPEIQLTAGRSPMTGRSRHCWPVPCAWRRRRAWGFGSSPGSRTAGRCPTLTS